MSAVATEASLTLAVADGEPESVFFVSEPRCKVCQSPHRSEIDQMLRRGDSQATVRRHWNKMLGREFFNANNISSHARHHLYGNNPTEWIQKTLRTQRLFGDPSTAPAQVGPEDALRKVMQLGMRLLDAGVTMPEPRDVIRAASELTKIEQQQSHGTMHEQDKEVRALLKALENNISEKQKHAIYSEYRTIMAAG